MQASPIAVSLLAWSIGPTAGASPRQAPADSFASGDPAERKLLATLRGQAGLVLSVAFQPNGKLLACADSLGGIRFWDPANGQ
jgi:WD40 repeat protein